MEIMMGDCAKCGRCCQIVAFTIPNLSNNRILREYYRERGCRTEKNTVIVPILCPHLSEDNLCKIHNRKPMLCKIWNGQKGQYYVPKECNQIKE